MGKKGEPNNLHNEDCAAVVKGWNGQWNDAKCAKKYPFVCETAGKSSSWAHDHHHHHTKTTKLTVLLKHFVNWRFNFAGLKFFFTVTDGSLVMKHGKVSRPMKLLPSKNKKYPASKGWFFFKYLSWSYYILITSKSIKMVGVHGGKAVTAKVAIPHKHTSKLPKGKGKGKGKAKKSKGKDKGKKSKSKGKAKKSKGKAKKSKGKDKGKKSKKGKAKKSKGKAKKSKGKGKGVSYLLKKLDGLVFKFPHLPFVIKNGKIICKAGGKT